MCVYLRTVSLGDQLSLTNDSNVAMLHFMPWQQESNSSAEFELFNMNQCPGDALTTKGEPLSPYCMSGFSTKG